MIFTTSNALQARQAIARLEHLISKGARVELTEKRGRRTLSQNNYLHLILTAWGIELGYNLAEMKKLIKVDMLAEVFEYKKKSRIFYKSTADLNTKEMTIVIDEIRKTAYESTGFYIPAPNEEGLIDSMQNYIDQHKE